MKKILLWIGKIILMLGLLAAAVFVWARLILSNSTSLAGPGPSETVKLLITVPIIVVYIFLCVIIVRFDAKK